MKIRIKDIQWNAGAASCSLALPGTLDMDVEVGGKDTLQDVADRCRDILNERYRGLGVSVKSLKLELGGADGEPSGTWNTTEVLKPCGPRMMWIRGDAGDALVNVDRISVIWMSKSNPDHGTLYMEDVASPIRVSLEDVKRLEAMCDVLEEDGDA